MPTAACHIEHLAEKYRAELATVGPYVVTYLERNGQRFPTSQARLCLTLVEATLRQLVPGYHAHTGTTGWTSQGPELARAELSAAARYGYCDATTAARLERQANSTFHPAKLLNLIARIWAAADKHSRQPQQAAA